MQINVTFRHLEPDDELKDYVKDRIRRFKRYIHGPIEAQIILTLEKFRNIVDITLKSDGLMINSQEETADMFSSIDMATEKIERQIKKYKEKIQKYQSHSDKKSLKFQMNILSAESLEKDKEPRIVKSRNFYAKPMSLEEAVMQLELTDNDFLVFTDAQTERVNVLYKRKDGDYGLIEQSVK